MTSSVEGVLARARRVRLLCVDVDGVLTDGGMYYGADGEVLKRFHTRDGMGLALVREAGIGVAIISGEDHGIIHARAAKLRIDDVYCAASDKLAAVQELSQRNGLGLDEVSFIGDDVNDLPALEQIGFPCAVADAVSPVRRQAAYVTRKRGGEGAVRELCELLLAARSGAYATDQALLAAVTG